MSLRNCLKRLGLDKHEAAILRGSAKALTEDGYSARDAAIEAIKDRIADVEAERADVLAQIDAQMPKQEKAEESGGQPGKIEDVGEKIGGARKDTATATGPRVAKVVSTEPGWRKRYEVMEIVKSSKPSEIGRWSVRDTRKKDGWGQAKQIGSSYATKESAEAAIPLAEVARNHRVVSKSVKGGEDYYEIVRDVTDRKRVKVVGENFKTRDDAMRYMAENAVKIIETKTSFGEEILPRPDFVRREGEKRRDGDVSGQDFRDTFGFRGVEFGNWNAQDERQTVMNHAYDALMDLADVLNVPPKAIGLNGELGLAFGARGHGLQGARAHYELDYGVINLTKMKGAGSLAHEWLHALDHYFGRQDGKAKAERTIMLNGDKVFDDSGAERTMVSHGFSRNNSGVRQDLRDAYNAVIQTMFTKAEKYVEDTEKVEKFTATTREELAAELDKIRKNLASDLTKDPSYGKYYEGKRNTKPASAEQLAAFDEIAAKMVAGELLETDWRTIAGGKKGRNLMASARWTNDALEKLSEIYKAVRGRSGFDSQNRSGLFDSLRGYMERYSKRLKMLAEAQKGGEKEKRVPTEYAMAAKEIDQGRGTDYWTTNHEMAARAFQSYVEDKIAEKGGRSDFLTYGTNTVVPTPWGWIRPFPQGSERKAINAAFDNFVGALQTKETEKGVALFSLASDRPAPDTTFDGETPDQILEQIRDGLVSESPEFPRAAIRAGNLPKPVQDAVDSLGNLLGRRIVVVRNLRPDLLRFNGFAYDGQTIVVDERSARNYMAVTGHEFLHTLRTNSPDLYAEFIAETRDSMDRGVLQEHIDRLNGLRTQYGLEPLSADLLIEEAVADFFGDQFMAPEFWAQVGKSNPSLVQRIAAALKDYIATLLKMLGKGSKSGKLFFDLTRAQAVAAKVTAKEIERGIGSRRPAMAMSLQGKSPAEMLAEAKRLTAGIRARSSAERATGVEQISDATLALNKADSDRVTELMRRYEDATKPKPNVRQARPLGDRVQDASEAQRTFLNSIEDNKPLPLELRRPTEDVNESGAATYTSHEVAPGVHQVLLEDLGDLGGYNNGEDASRIRALADRIAESGTIEPLFVALERDGETWLLEGQHRARALRMLGYKSVPAKIVLNTEAGKFDLTKRDQTDTKAFRDWFGDSVVTENGKAGGKPLVVYHGTGEDFTAFGADKVKRPGQGYGFHFAEEKNTANYYAAQWENGNQLPGGAVMPVYLAISNPFTGNYYSYADERGLLGNDRAITEALIADGYDGIKYSHVDMKTTERGTAWTAFRPEQIKSATGNRGTFDPKNPDIRFSLAEKDEANGVWGAPEMSLLDDVIYKLQDKQIDTKRVVDAIRDAKGTLDDSRDPRLQETLYHGRAAKATEDFIDKELKPLLGEMRLRGVSIKDFEEYLANRHAQERNEQIAKINQKMPDGGSGIKTADAQAYLSSLDPAKRAAYEALAKRVDALTKATRDLLVSSGLETQETVDAWEGAYQSYVPLFREDVEGGGTGAGFSVRGSASKRAMGGTRPAVDILANLTMQRERAIVRAEKNRVAMAVYGAAIEAPNADFWLPVNPDANERTPAQQAALEAELVSMGLNPLDAQNVIREPKQQYIDPRTGLVSERINPVLRNADNVLAVRINGKDRYVFFNAQDDRAMRMVRAMKNLDADDLGTVLGLFGKVTRWVASVNTQFNPVFGVVNFVRDVQGAMLNLSSTPLAGKQAKVAANILPALKGIYSALRGGKGGEWGDLWDEYQKEGGQTGYRDLFRTSKERTEQLESELRQLTEGKAKSVGRAVFRWLSDYNEAMENAVRLAAYKEAVDGGMTKQQAAAMAKELTVNFNRGGLAKTQAGALYAFFNAAVQGTTRIAVTLKGPAGRKIFAGGLTLGVMQALAMAAAGFKDDDPPEFVRERNIILPIGDGKFISIPMPLGFHVIPNTSRVLTEWALGGFRDTPRRLTDLLGSYAEAFNPIGNAGFSIQTIAPTAVDPLVALSENRDNFGMPIARKDFNSLSPTPGYTRAKDTASWLSKELSYYLNLASGGTKYQPGIISPTPDQIDFLIGQATGGVGREYMKAEQAVTAAVTGETLPANKIPLVGRFYGETGKQSGEGSRFYANIERINGHELEIKGRRKAGEPVAGYLKDHPEARLVMFANKTERDVSKLRKHKRELLERNAPKSEVERIEAQITAKMKMLNSRVEALKQSGQ